MKKCYWCAELIQDEARICRYCGKEVNCPPSETTLRQEGDRFLHYYPNSVLETQKDVDTLSLSTTDINPKVETKELPPVKWHQNTVVRSFLFGLAMGFILSNLLNIGIYFIFYLILGSIWRAINENPLKTDLGKRRLVLGAEPFFVVIMSFLIILLLSALME